MLRGWLVSVLGRTHTRVMEPVEVRELLLRSEVQARQALPGRFVYKHEGSTREAAISKHREA